MRVTARVAEGSGRPVERRLTKTLAPSSDMIGVKPLFDNVVPEGSEARFNLVGVNADAKADKVASKKDAPAQGKLGLALRPLQPDEKQQSGIDSGLLIQQATGPAALAGVQPGDVLLSINGIPVKSIEQVRAAVGKSDKSVALLIQRGESKIFVPVNFG